MMEQRIKSIARLATIALLLSAHVANAQMTSGVAKTGRLANLGNGYYGVAETIEFESDTIRTFSYALELPSSTSEWYIRISDETNHRLISDDVTGLSQRHVLKGIFRGKGPFTIALLAREPGLFTATLTAPEKCDQEVRRIVLGQVYRQTFGDGCLAKDAKFHTLFDLSLSDTVHIEYELIPEPNPRNGSVLLWAGRIGESGAFVTRYTSAAQGAKGTASLQPGYWLFPVESSHTGAYTFRVRALNPVNPTQHLGCSEEQSVRSIATTEQLPIRFTNTTAQTQVIYWLDFEGQRKEYARLDAGSSYEQPTFKSHYWLIADTSGQCHLIVYR